MLIDKLTGDLLYNCCPLVGNPYVSMILTKYSKRQHYSAKEMSQIVNCE